MLNDLCNRYWKNIAAYNELENYDFKNLTSKQEVLTKLKEKTQEKHKIYEEQNKILALLKTEIDDITHIDFEKYEILYQFALNLSQSEMEMDNAIAFEVHKTLLAYGEKIQNYDIIVEEIYWCGICEWKYYKIDEIRPQVSYFERMNDYERYLPVLSTDTRRRYLAGIINQLLYFTHKSAEPLLDKGREVLDKLEKMNMNYPDSAINFQAFRSIVYRNMLTAEASFREGIDKTEQNTAYVYEIAKKSMELIEEKQDTSIPFETVYYMDLYAAEFHAGVINIEQYLNKVDELCKPGEKFSKKENYNRVFRNSSFYIIYLRQYGMYDKKTVENRVIEKVKAVLLFLSRIKRDEESHYVSEYVLQFVKCTIDILPFELVREVLFRTTINQHRDTSVHNIMVQKIACTLLDETLEKRPEELIGVMGWNSVEEILANRDILMQIMEDMALIHDIGKYKCISIISNASRRLSDTEFSIIKKHPLFGYEIVKKASFTEVLKDGILLHHKWHNEKGGYPEEYAMTVNRPLVDILSVADSMDAATDPYGRSYGEAKTLDYMIAELDEMKGTRYAAFVVDILQSPMVKLKINYLLNHTRNHIVAYICQKNYEKVINYYPKHMQNDMSEVYSIGAVTNE